MKELEEVTGRDVPREMFDRLREFTRLLLEANNSQNLIARSSEEDIWNRHILDSAQLLRFARAGCAWTDIGTGAGLPGIVLAILDPGPKRLIEPRRRRVEFLAKVISDLSLDHVQLIHGKASLAAGKSEVVTARAVASPDALLQMSAHLGDNSTLTVLPRGRNAHSELAALRKTWQGDFRLVPSLTSSDASILVAREVRRKEPR